MTSACIRCKTCDSFPCLLDAKGDAEICAMRPALESENVKLMTKARVTRILTAGDAVSGLEVERNGSPITDTNFAAETANENVACFVSDSVESAARVQGAVEHAGDNLTGEGDGDDDGPGAT